MTFIAVTGSRKYTNRALIRDALRRLVAKHGRDKLVIVHGGADGADKLADEEAKAMGVHTARVDALWDFLGKPAGQIRNGVMNAFPLSGVAAFVDGAGPGTRGMIERAKAAGHPVWEVSAHGG